MGTRVVMAECIQVLATLLDFDLGALKMLIDKKQVHWPRIRERKVAQAL